MHCDSLHTTSCLYCSEGHPLCIGVVLFPGFQALDVFGPLDVLNILSWSHNISISLLSLTLDPVLTKPPRKATATGQSILPTHSFASAPPLDVLLIPGGLGTRSLTAPVEHAINFIRLNHVRLKYLITIYTETTASRPQVEWAPHARWVVDRTTWAFSGVSARSDTILAWVGEVFGINIVEEIARGIEYE
ncbi:class I glutamine amidotransferase-like protein [Aspergillus novoparasiticus]|uniref:Class I glutamine amidotransferase-like protein n=1 Tax=Aspergillus novoparasiticus TaxID=986946 RepID=A0A5N6E7N5_9EURO|nr:class I glutamine amidotransferase-like protein [Aspergillus novoparasiticus]